LQNLFSTPWSVVSDCGGGNLPPVLGTRKKTCNNLLSTWICRGNPCGCPF